MPKGKKGATANSGENEEQCGLCCKAIIEDRDEALFCEGSCNKWMHRYCAGVCLHHYEALQGYREPFFCSLCTQSKQSETIEEMWATIAALKEEVKELHATVEGSAIAISQVDKSTLSTRPSHETTREPGMDVVRRPGSCRGCSKKQAENPRASSEPHRMATLTLMDRRHPQAPQIIHNPPAYKDLKLTVLGGYGAQRLEL